MYFLYSSSFRFKFQYYTGIKQSPTTMEKYQVDGDFTIDECADRAKEAGIDVFGMAPPSQGDAKCAACQHKGKCLHFDKESSYVDAKYSVSFPTFPFGSSNHAVFDLASCEPYAYDFSGAHPLGGTCKGGANFTSVYARVDNSSSGGSSGGSGSSGSGSGSSDVDVSLRWNDGVGSCRTPKAFRGYESNVYAKNVTHLGEWGGECTCPDGSTYEVADRQDFCESLACIGGTITKKCSSGGISDANHSMGVTCGAANTAASDDSLCCSLTREY